MRHYGYSYWTKETVITSLVVAAMFVAIAWMVTKQHLRREELRAACIFQRIERRPSTCYRTVADTDWNGDIHSHTEPYDCEIVVECYLCDGGEECL